MMTNLDDLGPTQLQTLIFHLASGLAAETGEDFFFSLLGHLSRALEADFALVGELDPHEPEKVATLAVLAGGERSANFRYALRGTPCEQVATRDACVFESGVARAFPADHLLAEMGIEGYAGRPLIDGQGQLLGLLVVLFRKAVPNPPLVEQLLRIFAIRASSELERLHFSRRLAEQEQHFRQVFLNSPLPYQSVDRNGCLLDVNPAWARLFGFSRDAVIGRPFRGFLAQEALPQGAGNLSRLMTDGELNNVELEIVRADGEHRQVLLNGRAEYDVRGEFERSHCVLNDVTDRFRMQQQTLRTGQLAALGELAAGVAHEINNPVSGVINYAELLRNRLKGEGEAVELVERIIKEGDRIAAIVRQMLFFSRDNRGEMALLDPVDVLAGTLWFIGGHLHRDGIHLDVELAERLPPIRGQAQQLQQLLLNLLSNARYALNRRYPGADPAKRVRVSLDRATTAGREVIRLRVCDLGCGIPPELVPRVLQPFVTSKPSTEGTGLGLSICHEIVKQHGGTIWIESRLGDFTEVTVDLPITDREELHDAADTDS